MCVELIIFNEEYVCMFYCFTVLLFPVLSSMLLVGTTINVVVVVVGTATPFTFLCCNILSSSSWWCFWNVYGLADHYFTKSKGRNVALINWVVTLVALLPALVFLVKCPTLELVGVTVKYPDR